MGLILQEGEPWHPEVAATECFPLAPFKPQASPIGSYSAPSTDRMYLSYYLRGKELLLLGLRLLLRHELSLVVHPFSGTASPCHYAPLIPSLLFWKHLSLSAHLSNRGLRPHGCLMTNWNCPQVTNLQKVDWISALELDSPKETGAAEVYFNVI